MSLPTIGNFIDGRLCPARAGRRIEVIEPATGRPAAGVAASDASDVDDAVLAAARAFPAWSATPAAERSRILLRLADLVEAHLGPLAEAESRDTGKPLAAATRIDIPRSAANLRFFATAILHTASDLHEFDGAGIPGGVPALNYTLRRPRGVAGLISPWNLPLYLLTWKIAPALATGNTAVCKPSELTPTTATMLAELAMQAGLPHGVLNIVHGAGAEAGSAIVRHAAVPAISFTGSTAVGRWIAQAAGEQLKRVSLELGGKNAMIVFADADMDEAVEAAVRAGYSNQGQICLCGARLLVEERAATEFVERLVRRVCGLRVGDPRDAATEQGALTGAAQFNKVTSIVERAKSLGARVLCGGGRVDPALLPERCRAGYFFQPTLIEGLDPSCDVEQEEIFGPVVTIQRFTTERQAVAIANGTKYGLAATLYTRDLERAHRAAAALDAGIVWVNCWMVRDLRTPFGGMKQSGVGREGGLEALRFFTEPRNVCIRTRPDCAE